MKSVENQINRQPREQTWGQVWRMTQILEEEKIRAKIQREINDLVWGQIQGEITNTIFAQLMRL